MLVQVLLDFELAIDNIAFVVADLENLLKKGGKSTKSYLSELIFCQAEDLRSVQISERFDSYMRKGARLKMKN